MAIIYIYLKFSIFIIIRLLLFNSKLFMTLINHIVYRKHGVNIIILN